MPDGDKLKIHAHLIPEQAAASAAKAVDGAPEEAGSARARLAPESTGRQRHAPRSRRTRHRSRRRARYGDRLLRNSAYACALLLGILALGNVDRPWARRAVESIEQALTMHIDLDESIGELTFVRNLMPESTLVFLNVSGSGAMKRPVSGPVTHPWQASQPWLLFECDSAEVICAAPGTVAAVSPLSQGDRWGVLVDHGEGVETLYAALTEPAVEVGDVVERGAPLGLCDGSLYFEYRQNGESVDPSGALKL